MSQLKSDLLDEISEAVGCEIEDIISFSLANVSTNPIETGVLIEKEEDTFENKTEELTEKEIPVDNGMSRKEISLESTNQEELESVVESFASAIPNSNGIDVQIEEVGIRYKSDTDQLEVIAYEEVTFHNSEWQKEFAEEVSKIETNISTENDISSVSVRLMPSDDVQPCDYTIYFKTTEPHTFWMNCETLEDYCEMVAESNEDTSVEDMKNKDVYYVHTHLMNDTSSVDEVVLSFVEGEMHNLKESITMDTKIEILPYQLTTDFDGQQTISVTFSSTV